MPDGFFYLQVASEIIAIIVGLFLLATFILILHLARKARLQKPSAVPKATLTLEEQLQKSTPRPICYLDSDEVRQVYGKTLGPIPAGAQAHTSTTHENSLGVNVKAVSGSARAEATHGTDRSYEAPLNESLALDLMRELVSRKLVAFDVESGSTGSPDLHAFEQGLRLIAKSGYHCKECDSGSIETHKKKLATATAPSREDKIAQIEKARRDYHYIAVKGGFRPDGASGAAVQGLTLDVASGVTLRVPFMPDLLKEPMRTTVSQGGMVSDFVVFGELYNWDPAASALVIKPLVMCPNWTAS